MRLIDADALKIAIDDGWMPDMMVSEIWGVIDEAPTVVTDINVPNKWVSVKDRLPKDCEPVIVYMERDAWDRKGKFRRKKDIEKGWQIDGVWHVDGCSRVLGLYWMPLPEPPKDVNQEC